MFLLYFVLVSSSLTYMMNQLRQSPSSYRIHFHEYAEQFPRYMMMMVSDTEMDMEMNMDMKVKENKGLYSSHASRMNPIAGHDMRNASMVRRPRHHHSEFDAEESIKSFEHNFRQKAMLDYLQHDSNDGSNDDIVKMNVYQEYRRRYSCETPPCERITGPCLQAGTWPDLAEFDFIP